MNNPLQHKVFGGVSRLSSLVVAHGPLSIGLALLWFGWSVLQKPIGWVLAVLLSFVTQALSGHEKRRLTVASICLPLS